METYRLITVTIQFTLKKPLQELQDQVNDAMKQGWRPTGGPVVYGSTLMQALVRDR